MIPPTPGHGRAPAGRSPESFDLGAALPTGTTLLEASAGTGKTYTIAALATRWVAEGAARIDQLLLITFSRNATRELRERVRRSLVEARDAISQGDVGQLPHQTSPVVELLRSGTAQARAEAAGRLAEAVADFDSATIATTHEFCLDTLAQLGIAADLDPGSRLVEDISDVVDEVVEDFYLRKFGAAAAGSPDLTLSDARQIAKAVVIDPQAWLQPADASRDRPADLTRAAFASAVRAEVERRRRLRGLLTFDDLVLRLDASLSDPVTGPGACRRLRERYRVVLVDEFQDTDPAQWRILQAAFHGHVPLVLIGDPKQAIYAFRGADVFSYLEAASLADRHATLQRNHRSDELVVRGVERLLGGLELGDAAIRVHPVSAVRSGTRLSDLDHGQRVRLRLLADPNLPPPPVSQVRLDVAQDVARDIVSLLSGVARLQPGSSIGRPVQPGDIAVLVATNKQGDLVHEALSRLSVPAVVSAPRSVFATPSAQHWLALLRAIESPRRSTIRAVALTDFFGRTPADLVLATDATDEAVASALTAWAHTLEREGVASLLASITSETHLLSRVLTRADGERDLTDLRHIGAALHARQRETLTGVTGLLDWLEEQIKRGVAGRAEQSGELTRRLETDVDAVQILTVHRSKGLEFPIVYVPFGWDRWVSTPALVTCHDGSRRILDVRTPGASGRPALLEAHEREAAGESMRLLYVALTRGSSMVIAHWAASNTSDAAPLTRALGARAARADAPAPRYSGTRLELDWLRSDGAVRVEEVTRAAGVQPWAGPSRTRPPLVLAPYGRNPDVDWRRTSYTGLTSALHDGTAESVPAHHRLDEPPDDAAEGAADTATLDAASATVADPAAAPPSEEDVPTPEVMSPFAELPAGATFGTVVHAVLEVLDTDGPDLAASVARACATTLAARPLPGLVAPDLARALAPTLITPLGRLAGGLTLAGLRRQDRLAELDFELPMGSAHDPGASATLDRVADLVEQHLPSGHPLTTYPDLIRTSGIGGSVLRGYLAGSIDAVLRLPSPQEPGRVIYLVVDYKTNLVRPADPHPERPPAGHLVRDYGHDALAGAMMDAHYPLQALLYSVALHRYLRWRLLGYEPARDLGGVLYLFLRGMAGPATPLVDGEPCGVFSWDPGGRLIVALSDLLEGARP